MKLIAGTDHKSPLHPQSVIFILYFSQLLINESGVLSLKHSNSATPLSVYPNRLPIPFAV